MARRRSGALHDRAEANRRAEGVRASITTPGILLGLGLGGFLYGILLHQILQWHQMLSTTARWGEETVANMQVNMVADGLFHLVAWAFVAVGVGTSASWRSAFCWWWAAGSCNTATAGRPRAPPRPGRRSCHGKGSIR